MAIMKFTIKETDCRKLQLIDENKEIAQLNYKGWSSVKSEISLPKGEIFILDSKSMWKSEFQLKQGEKSILICTMNWSGNFLIKSNFDAAEKNFTFKSKGFWGKSYVLVDEKGNQLAEITTNYSWKGFKTEYTIETTADFDNLTHNTILMLIMVHCIRYYMTMVAVIT